MPSWKKLIVSGSDASLSSLTATSYGGNISGSSTSTGSFGAVTIDGSKNIHGNSNGIGIFTNAIDGSGITLSPDGTKSSTALTNNFGLGITHTGANGSYSSLQINTGAGKVLWVGNDAKIGIKNSDPVTELDVRGTISGSNIEAATKITTLGKVAIGTATLPYSGLLVSDPGGASSTSLENVSGVGITTSGTNTSYYALQVNTGTGALLRVNNGGIVDFPSATKISGSLTSTGSFGHIQMSGRNFPPQLFTTGSSMYMGDGGTGLSDDGSGNDNVGIGTNVLTAMATGAHNIAIGNQAMKSRTAGSQTIAIGKSAGGISSGDVGDKNVLIGSSTGYSLDGSGGAYNAGQNVHIGYFAGQYQTSALKNTFVGSNAGQDITTGGSNVAVGYYAGKGDSATAQTNSNSVFVGDYARSLGNGYTNEIVIGKTTTGKGSNTVTIGNDGITDFYITEGTQATLHTGNVSGSATSTGSFGAIQSTGNITPKTDDSVDLGASNLRFKNIFTTDLQLSNEGKENGNEVDGTTGSWTIQEGEEELYLLNRKNGKKYKFMLQEIK